MALEKGNAALLDGGVIQPALCGIRKPRVVIRNGRLWVRSRGFQVATKKSPKLYESHSKRQSERRRQEIGKRFAPAPPQKKAHAVEIQKPSGSRKRSTEFKPEHYKARRRRARLGEVVGGKSVRLTTRPRNQKRKASSDSRLPASSLPSSANR